MSRLVTVIVILALVAIGLALWGIGRIFSDMDYEP